jgi:hypothetical protein
MLKIIRIAAVKTASHQGAFSLSRLQRQNRARDGLLFSLISKSASKKVAGYPI